MTFPYPLTPEVRADLWRFFCPTVLEEHIAEMVAVHVHPQLHPYTVTPRDEALLDTPFARAFVAWREAKASPADADPTISALLAATRDLRTFTHRDSGSPGSAAHDAVDREFFRRLRIVEAADRAWVAAGCPQLPPKVTP